MKWLERVGRRWLVRWVGWLLGVPQKAVELSEAPRLLVLRLDERVGNLIMLTPLLSSLKLRYPQASIDVLVYPGGADLLRLHPAVSQVVVYKRQDVFAVLRSAWRLRRTGYACVIDAGNPTDPSVTQVLLTRFVATAHSVGPNALGFGRLYSAPVTIHETGHEIDLRLQLLAALPGEEMTRLTSLGPQPEPSAEIRAFLQGLPSYAVLNIGARLVEKRLEVGDYAKIVRVLTDAGLPTVVTYGPKERTLAEQVCKSVSELAPRLAPPSTLADLAAVFQSGTAVVTCDTGPMHLAVALGVPTCGVFVSTDPRRYGYGAPHVAIDARNGFDVEKVKAWLVAKPPLKEIVFSFGMA